MGCPFLTRSRLAPPSAYSHGRTPASYWELLGVLHTNPSWEPHQWHPWGTKFLLCGLPPGWSWCLVAQKSVNQKEAGMAEVTAARCCPTGHPTWHYSVSCQDQHEPLRVSSPAAGNPHSSKPTLLNLHPPWSSLEGEKGLEIKPTLFGGEKNRGAFGRGEGFRLPRAAAGCLPAAVLPLQPVCLSHSRRELPGAARAVRKTGSRTGGLWAGNREHGSSWETL